MRKIHLMLSTYSTRTIMTGEELTVADSGDHLRRRTAKFAQLGPPPDDWLLPYDVEEEVLLLDQSLASGMVCSDDGRKNSGELYLDW
jgi:hypothetical protein